MNTRTGFWISMGLNLALAGGILWKATHQPWTVTSSQVMHRSSSPTSTAKPLSLAMAPA